MININTYLTQRLTELGYTLDLTITEKFRSAAYHHEHRLHDQSWLQDTLTIYAKLENNTLCIVCSGSREYFGRSITTKTLYSRRINLLDPNVNIKRTLNRLGTRRMFKSLDHHIAQDTNFPCKALWNNWGND